jgi:peptidoglycan hydrolase-like protein with peptidoglycan-binding domain
MPITISEGSSGAAVLLAQYELCRDLYLGGPADVDGAFGSRTDQAVRQYQSDHGLTADGTVGAATWAAMLAEHPDPPVVKSGSGGTVVRSLQHFLNQALPSATPLVEDGSFGPRTEHAVQTYQSSHSVAADGVVGYKTWVIHIGAANGMVASVVGV